MSTLVILPDPPSLFSIFNVDAENKERGSIFLHKNKAREKGINKRLRKKKRETGDASLVPSGLCPSVEFRKSCHSVAVLRFK